MLKLLQYYKMFQQHIYPHLPVFLQNVAVSAYGLMWNRRRFGGIFNKTYNEFVEREVLSPGQWQAYQTQQLRNLLLHSYNSVPYYTSLLQRAGFTPGKLKRFETDDVPQIPALEKDTLRQLGKSELLSFKREPGGSFYSSSGSTGTPTSILYSYQMHQRLAALYEARIRKWAGVSRFDSRGMIGGRRVLPDGMARPPYFRYNIVEKQVYFSAYHISPATVKNYLYGMQKYKIDYMVGYAMSNYILARFIKEAGLEAPAMKAVLTSSEKLTPHMRELISEVYQCKTYDGWSGVEWCGLISENEFGQLLLSPDSAYVEILKPDGTPAKPGEEGELVCTGFLNYDQPLIRYRIGDVVRLAADQTTRCGRSFPVIEEIIGRTEDVVVGKDGREMVRFHGIFVNLENVVKGQIVQEDLDRFVVNVQTNGLTEEEKSLIAKRMQTQLGSISLSINEMSNIPVGNNGKFKAVISKVHRKTA
ncbi:MAG: phenylacetate--CoA ligase family protein [Segetibacter sp.]|nr:phenylacetate--CoA ligase family protein [Segetibacter sp.]